MKNNRSRKGRIEEFSNQEVSSSIQEALELLNKGFYLVENNTALEHKEGGYLKVSKKVSNYFNKKQL